MKINMIKELKKISGGWWFCLGMIAVYFILAITKYSLFENSLHFFWSILLKILPIFALVWFFMALMDRFITRQVILKYVQKERGKKWLLAVVGGILSAGAIYLWYPLLADLHKKGIDYGLIACFLYNRAIKLPLLPVAIYYFGWKYVIILTGVMIVASLIQGVIINKLMKED